MKTILVSAPFDDLRFKDFRFMEEASKLGAVSALLWSDRAVQRITGKPPKFPLAERQYLLDAVRYISTVTSIDDPGESGITADVLAVQQSTDTPAQRDWAKAHGMEYRVLSDALLAQVATAPQAPLNPRSDRKKVVVTGCYDYFHSGHVRFFEECSELGDLYVVVGHDANITLLKGEGHPLFPDTQRCFITGSIRYAKMSLVSSGNGWMDAEPEIDRINPDIYAVNEDGDKPEKSQFCANHGIEYRVLKRLPKEGLTRRTSTTLRGF